MASLQKRINKGREYWYLVESKRINGKPRPVVIEYFGSTKSFIQKLMDRNDDCSSFKSYSHGDTNALLKIAKKLEIETILDEILPHQVRNNVKRSTSLLLVAIQRVCSPGSKNAFSDWFETTTLPHELNIKPSVTTSHHFWDQMEGISEQNIMDAEDRITKKIMSLYDFKLDKIALDYTNYFSYISSGNEKCTLAKRGKNKQKRNDLRQFSLALVTTKEMGIPLYSHVYEGNINDQTEFKTYIEILKSRIPNYEKEDLTIVFDGGSVNKKNLKSIDKHYICRFSLSSCKELYDTAIDDVLLIGEKEIKYKRIFHKIWDDERTGILTFSQSLFEGEAKGLEDDLNKSFQSLGELKEKLNNPSSRIDKSGKKIQEKVSMILNKKHMADIIEVTYVGKRVIKDIGYEINEAKKEEIIHRYFGKKLIITSRDDWSSEEVLKTYYEQDCIEKIFRDSKNNSHFSMTPQYHFMDQKVRVHVFCCLLGLTLVSLLNKEMKENGIEISNNKLVEKLHGIRQGWFKKESNDKKESNIRVEKKLEEMNEEERNLWNVVSNI